MVKKENSAKEKKYETPTKHHLIYLRLLTTYIFGSGEKFYFLHYIWPKLCVKKEKDISLWKHRREETGCSRITQHMNHSYNMMKDKLETMS